MIRHNLIPGSPEWHAFRLEHDGSSEAAAMLGISKLTTRTELLRMKSTGTAKEFSDWVQKNILDYGHEVEANARPIIESLIDEDLSPITCSEGRLSASCDGLTFSGNVSWEQKQPNKELVESVKNKILPEEHKPQCYQNLLVTGAEKLIFSVSDGTPENTHIMDVYPDQVWFDRLLAGWKQFNIDRDNYQHVEVIPAAVATPTKDLPALSIQVNGSISLISNLAKFGTELNTFVAAIDKEPTDDQGFADAEAAIKTLQNAQDALEAAEADALAQTSDIDDMRKTVKLYADTARTTRLMLEKMVKLRKDSIRVEITQGGKDKLAEHIATLNKRLGKPYMPAIAADFATAVKGKRTITSLREAVNNELLRCQLESSAVADKIEINLNSLRELAKDHFFLFSDTQTIVLKNNDDLVALIKVRIDEHEKEVAAKFEAERAKMQAEATAKAEHEAAATLAAEEARIRAEERAKAKVEAEQIAASLAEKHEEERIEGLRIALEAKSKIDADLKLDPALVKDVDVAESVVKTGSAAVIHSGGKAEVVNIRRSSRPSDNDMIGAIQYAFGASYGEACDWLLEVAESLKVAA
jgi:predicted phage-related endonuclease